MLALALALTVAALPACKPGSLAGEAALQGATGSLLGELRVTNIGARACTLPERPTVRIAWAGTTLAVRRVQLAASPTPLRVLRPGSKAGAMLQWRNWCGQLPSPFRPRLLVTLGAVRGSLRVDVASPVTAPRCDSRYEPSTLAVGRFVARR
jgi:hypothetical protein